jgi:hypothetical protein
MGARVVSLVDRRSDREWLVQGVPAAPGADWASDDAVFGGEEAFGWDECLPTVSPCPDPLDPGGRLLRDHGEQWGRDTEVTRDGDAVSATWPSSRWPYTFRRSLRIDGEAVVADYELTPTADRAIPFLWSMHALLALPPGARLVVTPPRPARLTHHIGFGLPADPGEIAVPWPDGAPERLDVVRPITAGQAAKLYLDARDIDRVAARDPDGGELRFGWDRDVAPTLGVWLAYGGWPAGGPPRHQVALEPTTSPDDDLAGALAARRARWVEPGRVVRWSVRVALGAPDATPARRTRTPARGS